MKNIIKRILALTMVALLALVCLSGCSDHKPAEGKAVKKKVELIAATPPLIYGELGRGDLATSAYTDFLEYAAEKFSAQYEEADVQIRVVGFDYLEERQAITDKFDTPEAVDVLLEGFFNMGSYIHTGRLASLDDIIGEETRSDISKSMWDEGVYQGKTYMYPFYHLPNTMAYNAELFRQTGLERFIRPKDQIASWTLDDWEIILDTLAEKLPQSSFPMMMYGKNNQGDTHIMVLLRAFGCPFFNEKGAFQVSTPEGIQALRWIQDGVHRGWFPPTTANIECADCIQLFNNGQMALCVTNPANQTFFEKAGIDARLVNFPSADGKGLSTTFVTGFGVFHNGDDARVRAAKAFVQFVCSDSELTQAVIPNIPVRSSMQAYYHDSITMVDAYAANEDTVVNFTNNLPNWAGVRQAFYPEIHDLLLGTLTPEQAAANIDEACNQAVGQAASRDPAGYGGAAKCRADVSAHPLREPAVAGSFSLA